MCGRSEWWYSWTRRAEDRSRDFIQRLDVPLDTIVYPPAVLTLFLKDEWASLCDITVCRMAVEAFGGYEESLEGMYEDRMFHARLSLAFPAFVSSECWYRYRQHPASACYVNEAAGQ